MAKEYRVKGFIQNIDSMKMIPAEFIVYVSKDDRCTVTVGNENLPLAYCVDFTQILKDFEEQK